MALGQSTKWAAAGLVGLGILLATGLLLFKSPTKTTSLSEPSAATGADVDAVVKACAIGGSTSSESLVRADLAKYLQGISAGAKVTSSDVGAIAEKVTPSTFGVELYKLYTDCLKEQMAIVLSRRGITVVQPTGGDAERAKDKEAREFISEISPDTPEARLVQIFGEPVAVSDRNDDNITAKRYMYRHVANLIDYYKGGKRLGISLQTMDESFFPNQLKLNTDGSPIATLAAVADCEGDFVATAHGNIASGACGGSHADGYIYRVYVFSRPQGDQGEFCNDFRMGFSHQFDAARCPILAKAKADAVIFSREPSDATKTASVFLEYLDFGW